jgi:hypothetical protein
MQCLCRYRERRTCLKAASTRGTPWEMWWAKVCANKSSSTLLECRALGLNAGSFGEVFLATGRDGDTYIVKQIRIADMSPKDREEALNEVRLLSHFNHMNIIRYHESIIEVGDGGWRAQQGSS